MTANYTDNGDGTSTISWEYTTDTQRVLNTMLDAVHELYDRGYENVPDGSGGVVPFDDLTNAQRLTISDLYTRHVWQSLAKYYNRRIAVEAAGTVADTEDKYI